MAKIPLKSLQSRRSPPAQAGEDPRRKALRHYSRGNRFHELKLWDKAMAEWRRASQLWQPRRAPGARGPRFLRLRAVLAILFTAVLVHQALIVLFPRDPMELALLAARQQPSNSWWERFLDTGRPMAGEGHKMTVREWWERLKRRMEGGGRDEEEVAKNQGARPRISERWAELLRRYGRWGPFVTWDLDYAVISGNGLSRLGDYDAAVSILEEGIGKVSRKETLADLYQGLANAHYYRGYHLQPDGTASYDLGQVSRAARAYEQSLKNQPRPLSYGNLGWMYFLLGDYERSERFSKRALSMNSGLHYVRLNLGLVYLMQDSIRSSFETYYDVIIRNPPEEVFLGGITDLREIVRDYPGRYPFAYLMIGVLSIKKGDLGTARDALTRYLSGPAQGQYWKALARQLLEQMDTVQMER